MNQSEIREAVERAGLEVKNSRRSGVGGKKGRLNLWRNTTRKSGGRHGDEVYYEYFEVYDVIDNQINNRVRFAPTAEGIADAGKFIDSYSEEYARKWQGVRSGPIKGRMTDVIVDMETRSILPTSGHFKHDHTVPDHVKADTLFAYMQDKWSK